MSEEKRQVWQVVAYDDNDSSPAVTVVWVVAKTIAEAIARAIRQNTTINTMEEPVIEAVPFQGLRA